MSIQKHLNLGCGNNIIKTAWNVDILKGVGVDEIYDLRRTPWKWKSKSIDKIYLRHALEHFEKPNHIIKECHRILKVGGLCEICVPHSTSPSAIGCLGHYRTYSYNTLNDYLSRPFYVFRKQLFKTTKQRIIWQPGYEWTPIQWLIDLSPRVFERFWWAYVGGAYEIQWTGKKI